MSPTRIRYMTSGLNADEAGGSAGAGADWPSAAPTLSARAQAAMRTRPRKVKVACTLVLGIGNEHAPRARWRTDILGYSRLGHKHADRTPEHACQNFPRWKQRAAASHRTSNARKSRP